MTVVGSNAAYRTLRADRLARAPAGLDAAEAATLILSWTTAYQLLHRAARVQRGQRVLCNQLPVPSSLEDMWRLLWRIVLRRSGSKTCEIVTVAMLWFKRRELAPPPSGCKFSERSGICECTFSRPG
jgi:hypothetical protein